MFYKFTLWATLLLLGLGLLSITDSVLRLMPYDANSFHIDNIAISTTMTVTDETNDNQQELAKIATLQGDPS